MGGGNSACSSRWARCHEDMVARGDRVKNVATTYHRQPCNAIGSAALRGLVHEFTFTWVEENVQLSEERRARRAAELVREEERNEMMGDKMEAKRDARKQAKLAQKQRDAELEQQMREMETTDEAELALMAMDEEEPEPEPEPELGDEDGEALDSMSDVSTDSEIEFERSESLRETRASDERVHNRINFAVGLCESEFDVEEWARNSDKAWYLGGNTFVTQYGEYEGRASLYAKGVAGRVTPPVMGVGATVRLVVDLRPDHGRATFWMMPEKDGLEEEVGVIEGLPLRKVALHPFISLIDTGDVWELSDLTRRYDIEGDWIERAGFQECKAELASRSVDTEGIFEDQLESLRNLLREAIAREEAQEKARQHQAELDAAAEAERQEAARLEAEKEAKAQAERDAVDPNLVGCKTDGSVRVFVTGFGEGVYHKFHKPSRWAKDKTTLHTIILDNGEEVTKPWSECSVVEPSGSEGTGPDVSGSDSGGSGSDDEDDAQPEAEHMGPEPEPELEPESGEG